MSLPSDWLGEVRIAVIGLGYVGLPLAVEFTKAFPVTGFDIKASRIAALRERRDETLETTPEELAAVTGLSFAGDVAEIAGCNVYIVTVPTPLDRHKCPDLGPLLTASRDVGSVLKPG